MSWIKENKFLAALGGGTLAGVIILAVVGLQGSGRYATAKEEFDTASADAGQMEKMALYPKPEFRDGKRKALEDYRKSVESIQTTFEPFRPKEITNTTPQEFTNRLLEANTETRKAFEEAGTIVPEPYFVGFENYRTSLPSGNNTGILDYQLAAIKGLMLDLAKSKPSELKNLYRPQLPEESGQTYTAPAGAVARSFPLEITFTGTEQSAREFLSAVAKADTKYAVIRSLRILNQKKEPPLTTDAQFEAAATASAPAASDSAGAPAAEFVFPDAEETAAPEAAATPDAPASAAAAGDSSRILAQVLGSEQVHVFVRLDILEFLPVK